METAESNDCRGVSKKDGDANDVKIVNGGLCSFLFSLFYLIFLFLLFYFLFSIFRTTQVRVYLSHCHISHKDGIVTRLITELGRIK